MTSRRRVQFVDLHAISMSSARKRPPAPNNLQSRRPVPPVRGKSSSNGMRSVSEAIHVGSQHPDTIAVFVKRVREAAFGSTVAVTV
jgi:hypothetical protein